MAFEMALLLQASSASTDQVACLVLLDGSPSYVTDQVLTHTERLETRTQEEIDTIFLCGFVVQIVSSDYMKVWPHFTHIILIDSY